MASVSAGAAPLSITIFISTTDFPVITLIARSKIGRRALAGQSLTSQLPSSADQSLSSARPPTSHDSLCDKENECRNGFQSKDVGF